jgi:Sodium/calcium exchanger protein
MVCFARSVCIVIAAVFAAVYHAEVVAHRVGEPFGSLVLALAVTIIEVAMIVSVMITSGSEASSLARDTVFAAVMIVCNGIVGLCLLAGGRRHREQGFQLQGANAALAVLIALTTLTLVFPNVTVTTAGPTFSDSQLAFAAIDSLILYGSFLFVQTVRHRDYFLPVGGGAEEHCEPRPNKIALASAGLLLVAVGCGGGSGEGADADPRTGNRSRWRAEKRGGYGDRGTGVAPRGLGFVSRGSRETPADQHESRARFGACWYWADHPGSGCRVDFHAQCTRPGLDAQRNRAIGGDSDCQPADPGHRPDDRAARNRASGAFRSIPVSFRRAVTLHRANPARIPPHRYNRCAAQ